MCNLELSAGEIKIFLDRVVMSNLIGHCVEHTHYSSTVPHVITSSGELSFSPKECVAQHIELASDGHNTVPNTNLIG